MNIIITEKIADDGIEILKENQFNIDIKYNISHDDLIKIIDNYDAIIVRSATKINKDILEKGKNLKVVGRAGNGIDNIDVDYCTKKGIYVVNTPESNTMAAAELAVALAFSIFRNIPQAYFASKNKDFRRNKFVGNELDGKTAGIIGLGRIGSVVANKLKGCNMKIIAYDPYISEDRFESLGIVKCETLEQLLKDSDLISIHMPKVEGTRSLIGENELRMCKKGVRIVNAARGGIIDEKALYDALKSGFVAAAGIDVLETEPNYSKAPHEQEYYNPLLELDNVVITPHLGASTVEASLNVGVSICKLVSDVLNGTIVSAYNMPHMNTKDLGELKPFVYLADILAGIYYQAEKDRVEKIEIVYSGDLVEKDTSIISLAALRGFLEPIIENRRVNYVNAGVILKSMGLEFIESKRSQIDKYTNLITIKFYTKNKKVSVSGTVFAKDQIRIVDFFGYEMDFEPTPFVIAIQNIDKPGVVGSIGTMLGLNDINIAAMQLSRNRRGEKAVSFVSVDCEVSDSVISKLMEVDGILKVSILNFKV